MVDFVKLILLRHDVSQIIDGLTERMLLWRATAEYIETGYPQSADCVADCEDEQEASAIADHYQYVIDQITRQLDQQHKRKASIYIRLFHGRKNPNQEMDDWGFDGPVFGPYSGIHGVYCNYIHLTKNDGNRDSLKVHEDLVYYDNCYYGDWCILTEPSMKDKTAVFQQNKAELPKTERN